MSSTAVLVGVYQPGTSVLHRLPVGPKLLGVAALSVAVVAVRSMPAAFAFLAVALLLGAVARLRARLVWRATRFVLLVAVVVGAFQWFFYGRDKAVESFLDLVTLALVALTLTATTPVNAMLDAIVRWIGPLRRVGVDPERVALTFSLAIAALPGTVALALETRDAARARGLGKHPRAFLTPFVIRVVARAHETGAALEARGLAD
ncbi:cobalt transporter [Aeromicrobium sp. Root495]|uniref:energy-coupling factor transporter transmembrane component T family protein n=1 Tax=Aeromicrobium sp. Root495 TaxID=1736550 RepID=UPI0006F73AD5|nr:energy-coupling factor transporter transmembrane protein EcfT [Aeromicrobium sp. Root495]KQY56162.1 cobalt transporter [Aeromicrobium sp. Root495]